MDISEIREADWLDYAESAYRAYGVSTGMKAYIGNPMPEWADLPSTVKQAWIAAVKQVAYQLTHEADI